MIANVKANLRRCWKTLLATDLLFKLIAYVVLFPSVGLLFGLFVWTSGRDVLADTDIARFAISPWGLACLVLVGGAAIAIYALEHAVLLSICLATDRAMAAPATSSLRFVVPKFPAVMQLASIVVGRVLIMTAPLVAIGGLTYWWLLTDKDINFYLQAKPTEFWLALVILALLLCVAVAIVLRFVLPWALALPILLFEDLAPRSSLAASVSRLKGHRVEVAQGLAIWVFLHAVINWLASAVVVWIAYQVAPLVVESFATFIVVAGGLVMTVSLINYAAQWFANATFASWMALVYRKLSEDHDWQLSPPWWIDQLVGLRLSGGRVIAGFVLALLVSTIIGVGAIESVRWDGHVEVVAHRGGAAIGPENTLAVIENAITVGADWIEIDVQESSDGVVMVIHDSDLAKVGGNPIKVWEAPAETLRTIDIGSHFDPSYADQRVPTLEEVLALCKDRVKINIELKYYGHDQDLERKVVDLVERFEMGSDIVVMSLKLAGVKKVKQLRPNWQVGLLTAVALGDLSRVDVDFLAVNQKLATRAFINRAQSRGKWVAAWTINRPEQMSELAGRDIDQIITDDPELAKSVLRWRDEMSPLSRLAIELAHYLGIETRGVIGGKTQRNSQSTPKNGFPTT